MLLRNRLPEDLPAVRTLLAEAALPPDGLEATEGWVIELAGRLVGHVALEPAGPVVVIRSLVVAADQRGAGHGARLMDQAERAAGSRLRVLKTDTVGPWMEARGYRRVPLASVPAEVRATTQFAGSLCAGTPVYVQETTMENETIKAGVRERYGAIAKGGGSCCGPKGCGCDLQDPSLAIGYQLEDLAAAPEGANLGLGCGNPTAIGELKPGETVLDLGSGAGFDAFLAARKVGPEGRVIGVDMTPEMLAKARELAARHGFTQVDFRQGDIEALPVGDGEVDVVISNCVINLATDKAQVFREAFRVLKAGGRLQVSDLVLLRPLSPAMLSDLDAYAACLSGALLKDDYLTAIQAAGFVNVAVTSEKAYAGLAEDVEGLPEGWKADADAVVSLAIRAEKPARGCGCTCC